MRSAIERTNQLLPQLRHTAQRLIRRSGSVSRAPMSTCFAAYPFAYSIGGKTRRGFSLFAVRPRRGCHLGQQPDAVLSCSYLLLSFFHQGRVTLHRVLVLRIDGAEAHASSFSCSHDHDHAGEWRRFTGPPIHLILQTSVQKPDFRTVQDMVLEPAGVRAGGNQ